MSDNIVQLRAGVGTESERRAQFLDAMAHSFDLYVKDYGQEPDALVYVLGGLKQSARVAWHIDGDSHGGATSMLALANAVLSREIIAPNG